MRAAEPAMAMAAELGDRPDARPAACAMVSVSSRAVSASLPSLDTAAATYRPVSTRHRQRGHCSVAARRGTMVYHHVTWMSVSTGCVMSSAMPWLVPHDTR